MLRKLLKHEFRATGRLALPLCIGMIALSVLAAIAMMILDTDNISSVLNTISVWIVVIYMMGLFALAIGIIVVVLNRFYKSVLREEGYLTLTLPASLGKILSAKLICALVWYVVAFAIACASVVILLSGQIDWRVFLSGSADFFSFALEASRRVSAKDIFWFVSALCEGVMLCALVALQVTLHFYAAMAIGHSFSKSKVLLSVVAFFVLSWIYSAVGIGGLASAGNAPIDLFRLEGVWSVHAAMGVACGVCLVTDAVLYVITHLCLRYKLNLE